MNSLLRANYAVLNDEFMNFTRCFSGVHIFNIDCVAHHCSDCVAHEAFSIISHDTAYFANTYKSYVNRLLWLHLVGKQIKAMNNYQILRYMPNK